MHDQCHQIPSAPIPIINGNGVSSSISEASNSSYNEVPTIMVSDAHGKNWKAREDKQGFLVIESPSASTSSLENGSRNTLTAQSPCMSTHSLDNAKDEESFDSRNQFQSQIRRFRHYSANEAFNRNYSPEISEPVRFFASEEELNQFDTSYCPELRNQRKTKYLDVEGGPDTMRKRSASTDAVMLSSSGSSGGPSLVKRLLQRLRSQSQGDIAIPPNFKANADSNSGSTSGSKEDVRLSDSNEDLDPSALNTGLLSRIKKHFKQPRGKRQFPPGSPPRRNSDYCISNVGLPCDESWEARESYGDLEAYYQSWNSDYPANRKPKKKGLLERNFVSRFKERHLQPRKRDRGGSLPNVLDDESIRQQQLQQQLSKAKNGGGGGGMFHKRVARKRSKTLSDKDDIVDKTVYMGEFAIDDNFENVGLSLENLTTESPHMEEKSSLKSNLSNYSLENIFRPFR